MKNLLIILAILLINSTLFAQDGQLYWKYKDYDDSKSFSLPGFFPKFASLFVNGKENRRLLRHIGRTRIMLFEKNSPLHSKDFVKLTKRTQRNGGLSELISIKEGKTDVRILAKENGRRIRKLVVLVQSEDAEFVMISIKGRFRYNDINKLIKRYNKDDKKLKNKPKIPVKIPIAIA